MDNIQGKKLTRSNTDKMLGGVAGGIADYTGVDATLIRLVTAVAILFTGVGPIAYVVAWLLIPSADGNVIAGDLTSRAEAWAKDQKANKSQGPTDPFGPGTNGPDTNGMGGVHNQDDLR